MKGQNMIRTHAGAWNMIAGALLAAGAVLTPTATVIDQAGLLVAGFIALALSIAAKWVADRDLNRLLDAVATRARTDLEAEIKTQHQASTESWAIDGRPSPRWRPPAARNGAAAHAADRINTPTGRPVGT